MKNEYPEPHEKDSTPLSKSGSVSNQSEAPTERLERVEAALKLLLDHTQTSTKGSEILEANHSRDLLSSIAFGISAVGLIAMWTIDLVVEENDIEIFGPTIALALFWLASTVDILSGSLLRKAVYKAMVEKEPSRLVIWQGSWHRLFKLSYWSTIRHESEDFYYQQITRSLAFSIYILSGIFLIYALFTM